MLDGEELHVAAANGGVEDVYTCPAASIATQALLDGHARAEMPLPEIGSGADQLAAANGGAEELSTLPLKSVATHTPPDGQSTAEIPFASMLDEGADHVEAPPAGSLELRTEPLSSNATHALAEAHARLKIPPPLGSTTAEVQAAAPPVGLVEVRIRPAPSVPTHTPLDGHDCANSCTGFSPGATSNGLLHIADAPLAAFAEFDTCPPGVPATHNEAVPPAQANASVAPEARFSETHAVPPSVETLVVVPLLAKQITLGLASAESAAHETPTTGTLGVDNVHVGVAAPGLVLVAIWFPEASDPAAMQKLGVAHENPLIELSPVAEEVAEAQEEEDPGVSSVSTVPLLVAMKHWAADGHALNDAPARLADPTSPHAAGFSASADAHTSSAPLVSTQTVPEGPGAHDGAPSSDDGAILCTLQAEAPPVGLVDVNRTLLPPGVVSVGSVPRARQNGPPPCITQLTPNST
jgi:hypothetical protein